MDVIFSRFLLLTLPFLLGFSATSTAQERKLYQWTVYTSPSENTVHEIYVGDRLIQHGHGEWKDCLTPRRTLTRTQGYWTGEYRAGSPICKSKPDDKYYQPFYKNASRGGESMKNAVSWDGENGNYRICQRSVGFRAYCVKNLSENDVKFGETFVYSSNNIQQTIEYSGRNADMLSFTYAEFSGGVAREAFNRTFTIDLSGGNVMAYKGAVIEILEATNAQIKYRVVRAFPTTLRND